MLYDLQDDYYREKRVHKHFSARDLITLHAKYHRDCYLKILHKYQEIVTSPKDTYVEKIDQAMEGIYTFMVSNDDYQLSEYTSTQKSCQTF